MKNFVVCLVVVVVGISAPLFAQEFTTSQILAKLDENAKIFSSLEAKLSGVAVVDEVKAPAQSGKLYIKMEKSKPRLFWDVTEPKNERMKVLIERGMATVYFTDTKSVKRQPVDTNSDVHQLLVLGFGVPSSTINRNYSTEAKGRQTVGGVQAVVLELKSMTKETSKYPRVTLFLDPKTWTPVRTRIADRSDNYTDYNYSEVKLNKGVSDSVFNLKLPKDVK